MNAQPQPTPAEFVTWLPVPDRRLSPNARVHWRSRASLVKAYRLQACGSACASPMGWHEVTARLTFVFPDRRRRDHDNLNASMKAAWDGFTDAGLLLDDDRITHLPSEIVYEPGCVPVVKIEIWPNRQTGRNELQTEKPFSFLAGQATE